LSRLGIDLARLPVSLRILLENLLRHEDGDSVTQDDIRAPASWTPGRTHEIAYYPGARGDAGLFGPAAARRPRRDARRARAARRYLITRFLPRRQSILSGQAKQL
jgi:hypothetical protein